MSEQEETKTAVDVAAKNTLIEKEALKLELESIKAERDSLKKALILATDTIEKEQRAKYYSLIKANTTLGDAEIKALSLDSMFELNETFRIIKRNPVAGIRPGEPGPEQDSRFTVPKKFKYGQKEA